MFARVALLTLSLAALSAGRPAEAGAAGAEQMRRAGERDAAAGVEWPAADRASLEARLARGLVAVRAQGCEIEVLRQCSVPGSYS